MIGYLQGKVLFIESDKSATLTVDVHGVGYEVHTTLNHLKSINPNQEISLIIHSHIKEDSFDLFGFETQWEKKVFLMLTSVSGIGPRTAMGILNNADARLLLSAIVKEDKALLTSIQGIGKKTAERIFVELKEKAQKLIMESTNSKAEVISKRNKNDIQQVPLQGAVSEMGLMTEAVSALTTLGYKDFEAWELIQDIMQKHQDSGLEALTTEKIIKKSLQRMAQK